MSQPSAAATVARVDAKHRYEILVGGERAGLTAYRDRGQKRVFFHTQIDDAFAGQGLAAQLVHQAGRVRRHHRPCDLRTPAMAGR